MILGNDTTQNRINDDKTSSNTVPLYIPLYGVDPGSIRRGGGISHRVSSIIGWAIVGVDPRSN
jgi:hypothetical protein